MVSPCLLYTSIPRYKVVNVFDVSQTDGKEIPDMSVDTLTGSIEQYEDFWRALKEISPVPVELEKIESGAHGYYSPVSYTHLDVYKRQRLRCPTRITSAP